MFDSGEYAVPEHPLLLGLAGVDAVRHDTGIAAAEQAELVIGVAVELALGAKLADPVDLAVVFGQMALHRQIVLFAQARKAEHQIVRAGGDEARRKDGLGVGVALGLDVVETAHRVGKRGGGVLLA